MKKIRMTNIATLLTLFMATASMAANIGDNSVKLGKSGSTLDKSIVFDTGDGASNKKLILKHSSKQLSATSNTVSIGDAAASDKALIFDRGGSNAQIKWNESAAALEFSKDGTTFKKFGSGSGSGGSGVNILTNSGFEDGSTANWTSSGGTYAEVTGGADLLFEEKSVTFDASSTGQYFESDLYTVPAGLQGGSCSGSIYYKGGDANLVLKVIDGTAVVLASATLEAATYTKQIAASFPCPTSGTFKLRVESTANAAIAAFDNAKLGDLGTFQVAQAEFVGAAYFPATASCEWQRTNTAVGAFSTDTDCPGPTVEKQGLGSWQTTDTNLPQFTVNNLPAGIYKVTVTGSLYGAGDWTMAVSDGTDIRGYASGSGNGGASFNPANVSVAWFEYSTSGNRTFEVYGSSSSGAISLTNAASNDRTHIVIERYPLQTETAIRADKSDFGWISGGTLTITGTTSNPTKGTTATDQVWYRRKGDSMEVRVEYRQSALGSAAAGSGDYLFTIPGGFSIDTAKATAYATVEGSGAWAANNGVGTVTASLSASNFVGNVIVYDATRVRFCGLDATSYGCVNSASFYSLDNAGTSYQAFFTVPIVGWSENQAAPQLVNSVVSPLDGVLRLVSATITNTGTPTVARQTGSWISSITDNGTGDMTINFTAGTFSTIPSCVVSPSPDDAAASIIQIYDFGTARSTSLIRVKTFNGSLAADDQSVDIFCTGSR